MACNDCKYQKRKACLHSSNIIEDHFTGKDIPKYGIQILNYNGDCPNYKYKESKWTRFKEWLNNRTTFFRRLKNEIMNGRDPYTRREKELKIVSCQDLWSLDYTIAIFLVPRLEELKKILEKWVNYEDDPTFLPKMQNVIDFFKEAEKEINSGLDAEQWKAHKKKKKQAFKDFEEIYYGLWW